MCGGGSGALNGCVNAGLRTGFAPGRGGGISMSRRGTFHAYFANIQSELKVNQKLLKASSQWTKEQRAPEQREAVLC